MTKPTERLSDGKALDRLTEQAEQWAKSYGGVSDESKWEPAFTSKFERVAASLARQCTEPARRFTARDWILGIILWLTIAAIIFVLSVFVLALETTWTIAFGIFAVLVAIVGLWQSYLETTSEKRAGTKLQKKEEWLMAVSKKAAMRILAARQAESK